MNLIISTFFGENISSEEKLYNFATLLISAFSLLYASFGVIFLVPVNVCVVFFGLSVTFIVFVYVNSKVHKHLLFTLIELILSNFVVYPFIFLKYGDLSVETPVYFMVGLVYSLVLL